MRQKDIFLFWLPLWASWMLMTAEGPLLSSAVNRLPNEVVMLAALGIVFSLAVTIESPVINLLATATAVVKDRASYLLVRRFTVHSMVLLALVGAILALTPAFDWVVRDLMGTPEEIAEWVQPGLAILIFWPPAIAWRRFLQGVLIHFGQTRLIARGTFLRLVVMVSTTLILLGTTEMAGVVLAATAMMASVLSEAIYATFAVQPLLRDQLAPGSPAAPGSSMSYRELFYFHLPLAGTGALALLAQPLVTFTLARLDQPTLTLAAWPLIFQTLLVLRAPSLALPEAVIALSSKPDSAGPLRRFAWTLALLSSASVALLAFTPLAVAYLSWMQDTVPEVAALARQGLAYFVPLPGIAALVTWMRGRLIHRGATRVVNEGTAVNLVVLLVVLGVGLEQRWPGLATAALALNASWLVQLGFLAWRWRGVSAKS